MKKTYLVLALLIIGCFSLGDAYGGDEGKVYYCGEIAANGFYFNKESSSYKPASFKPDKFKLKLEKDSSSIELKGHPTEPFNGVYTCSAPYTSVAPAELSCVKGPYHFNFNTSNGRFVFAPVAGYVNGDGDTITVAYGKYDKF